MLLRAANYAIDFCEFMALVVHDIFTGKIDMKVSPQHFRLLDHSYNNPIHRTNVVESFLKHILNVSQEEQIIVLKDVPSDLDRERYVIHCEHGLSTALFVEDIRAADVNFSLVVLMSRRYWLNRTEYKDMFIGKCEHCHMNYVSRCCET